MYKAIFSKDLENCSLKTIQNIEQSIYKCIERKGVYNDIFLNRITSSQILKKLINPINKKIIQNTYYNNLYTLIEDYNNNYKKVEKNINFLKNINNYYKNKYECIINNSNILTNTDVICNITEVLTTNKYLNQIVLFNKSNIYIININKNIKKSITLEYSKNGYILNSNRNLELLLNYKKNNRFNYITISFDTFDVKYHYNKYIKCNNLYIKDDLTIYISNSLNKITRTVNKKTKMEMSLKLFKYIYNHKILFFVSKNFLNAVLTKEFNFGLYNSIYYKVVNKTFNYYLKHNINNDKLIIFKYIFDKVYNIQNNTQNNTQQELLINNEYYKKNFTKINKNNIQIMSYKNIRILVNLLNLNESCNYFIYNKVKKEIIIIETNDIFNILSQNVSSSLIIDELKEHINQYNNINNEDDFMKYVNEYITLKKQKDITNNITKDENIIVNNKNYYTKFTDEECKICFDNSNIEKIHIKCNEYQPHVFCVNCCIKWFSTKDSCPYCRKNIILDLYQLYDFDIFCELFVNNSNNTQNTSYYSDDDSDTSTDTSSDTESEELSDIENEQDNEPEIYSDLESELSGIEYEQDNEQEMYLDLDTELSIIYPYE